MEITADSIEWTSEDVSNWRTFLQSRTGSKLLPKVTEAAPQLCEGGETNKILIRNGEVLGLQRTLRELLSLAYPPAEVKPQSPEYPALTNDEAWNDGQKIEPNPQQ